MKRRAISAAAVLAVTTWLVFGLAPAAWATAVVGTSGGFAVSADDADVAAGAAITGYSGPPGAIVIPSTVVIASQTYTVTSIANFAMALNTSISSVTIPGTVSTIGSHAFFEGAISSVTFSEGLTSIGDSAFFDDQIHAVEFPSTLTSLGSGAFDDNGLASATFLGSAPAGVTGTSGVSPSLGASPLTVYYPWRFGPPTDTAAGAFTTPAWLGYTTVPVVTVTFDLDGHGSPVAAQQVVSGTAPSTPADPSSSGATFTGWFTDATLTTRFDFGAVATADETVFAGWSALAETGVAINPFVIPSAIAGVVLGVLLLVLARRRRRSN